MAQRLRDAIVKSMHGKEFLPLDALDTIVTRSSVSRELRQSNIDHSVSAVEICRRRELSNTQHSKDRYTSCQKVFAILVLIDEVPLISDFLAQGLSDADLPFQMIKQARSGRSLYALVSQSQNEFPPPNYRLQTRKGGWTLNNMPLFVNQQWAVCAPFFTRAEYIGERAYLYSLSAQDVLPFIEFDSSEYERDDLGPPSYLQQGSANVDYVKIHPAHHSFPVKKVTNFLYQEVL